MSKQEKRAFETFVASELRKREEEEFDFSTDVELDAKEQAVLDKVGDDFLDQVMAGKVNLPSEETEAEGRREFAGAGGTLFRADDVSEEDALELEKQEKDLIERKRKESGGEQSS